CLLLGLSEGENWGWTSARVIGLFVAAVVTTFVWIWVETRVREPLVDMRMLSYRPVLFTNITTLIASFPMFGTVVLIPNFVEMGHGVSADIAARIDYGFSGSATKAGLYLLPSSIMLLFSGPIAGRIGVRVGFKWPLAVGLAIIGVAAF